MSLKLASASCFSPNTARIACAALPHGNRYLTLHGKPGTVSGDAVFAHFVPQGDDRLRHRGG